MMTSCFRVAGIILFVKNFSPSFSLVFPFSKLSTRLGSGLQKGKTLSCHYLFVFISKPPYIQCMSFVDSGVVEGIGLRLSDRTGTRNSHRTEGEWVVAGRRITG